jgi:hypothetical protein
MSNNNPWRRDRAAARRRFTAFRPSLECLEARRLLSIWTVTSTADDGSDHTLRWAIEQANNDSTGVPDIAFLFSGSQTGTIKVLHQLPAITQFDVRIGGDLVDGRTGSRAILDGSLAGHADGLVISGAHCNVREVDVTNFDGNGIVLSGAGATQDTIGIDSSNASDMVVQGNQLNGVLLEAGANNNEIRGISIRVNGDAGIRMTDPGTAQNRVLSCWIGTDASGASAAANLRGVVIENDASDNAIGETEIGNVISGNLLDGVEISGSATHGNTLFSNKIGTTADGTGLLGNGQDGVVIDAGASQKTVGGYMGVNFIGGNWGAGVRIAGAGTTMNLVADDFIGSDGTHVLPNLEGVVISGGASVNSVGTLLPTQEGDVIEGNTFAGVYITGPGTTFNQVETCDIGPFSPGSPLLANQVGVQIDGGATDNIVGGTDPNDGNIISGNSSDGVKVSGAGTSRNLVINNNIGGETHAPNGADGVFIGGGATGNVVGAPQAGNTIANNGGDAVDVRDSVNSLDPHSAGNLIRANRIYGNRALGIDLGGDGVTLNTPGGPHTGPNDLQNYPVLAYATSGTIRFNLDSAANDHYVVDFYANDTPDPSGHGQGRTWLGAMTGVSANTLYTFSYAPVAGEPFISATATDSAGNTSEFSGTVGPPQLQVLKATLLVGLGGSPTFRLGSDPKFPGLLDLAFGGAQPSTVSVDPTAFKQIVVNGAANDVIGVDNVPAGVSIAVDASTGGSVNVCPSARNLGTIQGNLSVTAGKGTALNIDDSGAATGRAYTLTSTSLTWGGKGAIGFKLSGSLNYTGSAFNNAVTILSLPANSVMIRGGVSAINMLVGPDTNNSWVISGADSGTLDGVVSFSGFARLIGGAAGDTFGFQQAGTISGIIDGAGGTNALDYSQRTGATVVDLALNLASAVNNGLAGSVFHIANVTGGAGDSLLVGDARDNTLTGGIGRNILIGGAGTDTLDASRSAGDNILIGGGTDWDINIGALNAIFAEWTRIDLSFPDRLSDLLKGTNGRGAKPLNLVNGLPILLTPSTSSTKGTVHADGAKDTLIGTSRIDPQTNLPAHDWFLADAFDVLLSFDPSKDRKDQV